MQIHERPTAQGWLIEVRGELDMATAPRLQEALTAAIDAHPVGRILADLRPTELLFSAGMGVLAAANKRLQETGRRLVLLVTPGSQPWRVIELAAWDRFMELAFTLEEACGGALPQDGERK